MEIPDRTVMIYGERHMTFSELARQVDNLALGLLDLGLVHGDRIALCLPDVPEYTFMYYAAARLGLVSSPISVRYREQEFLTILGHSEARAVAVPAGTGFDYVAMVQSLRPHLPKLEYILVLGEHTEADRTAGVVALNRLLATDWQVKYPDDYLHRVYLREHPVEADDLLEIGYTSGTTGAPKGAMMTHNHRAGAALLNCEAWGARHDDVMVVMSPLTHSIGCHHSQNAAVLFRLTAVYLGQWEPEYALREAERTGATILIGVPAMFIAMKDHPNFHRYDLSRVRGLWCAGSPVPYLVAKQFCDAFGAQFFQTYGSTECGGIHCTRPEDALEVSCGSVGPPVRGMETKVIEPQTGRIVPLGVSGELCIRGMTRTLGYYHNPEATAAAIDGAGWFHTGDLAVMDEHGYVRINGRIKDMIIRGGQNIYATEMEALVSGHPAVQQAYVVGYPDDYLGERTCAFVVPRQAGTQLTRADLVTFFADRVAKYKIPDRVETVADLPLTASGKVQKFKLREQLLEQLKAQ